MCVDLMYYVCHFICNIGACGPDILCLPCCLVLESCLVPESNNNVLITTSSGTRHLHIVLVPDYTTQDLAGPDYNVLVNIYNNNVLITHYSGTRHLHIVLVPGT
jgi:hypothetical protein